MSAPYEVAEFDIMYGDGINALGCVFDVAKELDVLEGRVSTLEYWQQEPQPPANIYITHEENCCCTALSAARATCKLLVGASVQQSFPLTAAACCL